MNSRSPILTVVVAAPATPLWAGTALTFDVVGHTEARKGAKQSKRAPMLADAHYSLTVTLWGDTLQIDEPDTQTRYDFKKARIDRLNKAKNSYDEVSLYTVVGFKAAEFTNRMYLAEVLAAGKIKDNPIGTDSR